jgi:hypothetical protein
MSNASDQAKRKWLADHCSPRPEALLLLLRKATVLFDTELPKIKRSLNQYSDKVQQNTELREAIKALGQDKTEPLKAAIRHSLSIFGIGRSKQAGETVATNVVKIFKQRCIEVHPDKHALFCTQHNIIDNEGSLRPMLQTAFKALQDAKELVQCWLTMGGEKYVPLEADVQTAAAAASCASATAPAPAASAAAEAGSCASGGPRPAPGRGPPPLRPPSESAPPPSSAPVPAVAQGEAAATAAASTAAAAAAAPAPVDTYGRGATTADGGAGGCHELQLANSGSRFRDLSFYRLTVVHTCFWEAILAIEKLVEFRSPRQPVQFFPGLRLLFSLNAAERKKGRTDLIEAVVLEIVTLSCDEAYARFSRETQACDLKSRCAKWGSKTVQCLVLDPNSIGVAHDIQHLSVGNQGVLRQIDDTNKIARFCRSSQLGTTETVQLSTGESVRCIYTRTWPKYPESRRKADS